MRLKKEALAVRLHTLTPLDAEAPHELHTAGPSCAVRKADENGSENGTVTRVSNPSRRREDGTAPRQGQRTARAAKATKNGKAAQGPAGHPLHSRLLIDDVTRLTVAKAKRFFEDAAPHEEGPAIAERSCGDRRPARLHVDVGLGYLTLDRKTGSLSGGEAQRIRLRTQVGSGLVGVCYVLDEPTIGLHQRDNTRLIRTPQRLSHRQHRHHRRARRGLHPRRDYLIDIGPAPRPRRQRRRRAGPCPRLQRPEHDGQYLTGDTRSPPRQRRPSTRQSCIELRAAARTT
jgi:excinuclease UvrABC ATPase subunit